MTIANPLTHAYNWFLAIWTALPQPFQAFIALAVGLFVVATILQLVFR